MDVTKVLKYIWKEMLRKNDMETYGRWDFYTHCPSCDHVSTDDANESCRSCGDVKQYKVVARVVKRFHGIFDKFLDRPYKRFIELKGCKKRV